MTRRLRSTSLHYFTLIEMLVVIAIIALLAAILLPALRRALKEAREVVCMNNIHQLCVAATTYKEDYYGDYPPPVSYSDGKVHPHDLKASDIGHIASYIGISPSQLDLTDDTLMTEKQWPAVMRCPFSMFFGTRGSPANFYGNPVSGHPFYYPMGYAYFGSLTMPIPPNTPTSYGPAPGFERKFASRNCDPDAALWGDSVAWLNNWGYRLAGYIHTMSGRENEFWHNDDFANFDRQNLGYVDGSVKIRWRDEVQPNIFAEGRSSGTTSYCWWFYRF